MLDGTTKGQARALLALRVGGRLPPVLGELNEEGKEWTATITVLELVAGKTAREQVRLIEEVWSDMQQRQRRMGVKV